MPVFEIELSDGKKFQVETDRPPTEADLPDIMAGLQSGGIQKMNPTKGQQAPVDREAWMKDVQPGEGVSPVPMAEQPLLAIGMLCAGALNLGKSTLQKLNGLTPEVRVVDGKIVRTSPVRDGAVARFETTGPSGDLAQTQEPAFQYGVPTVQARFANEDVDPISRVVGNTLRGFTTPEGIATIGLGGLLKGIGAGAQLAQAVPLSVFGAPMLAHAPESTKQAAQAVGGYVGTPEGQRTVEQKDAMVEAVANEVVSKLMLAGMAGHGRTLAKDYIANRPITPEVLPKQEVPVAPVGRQIQQPAIDVEVLSQPQIPDARRFYQSESKNPPVDARQLTQQELDARLAVNKPFEQSPAKQTYDGGPVIIGENQPQNIAKSLGVRYDGKQEMIPGQPKEVYTSLNPDNPFTVYVDVGTPRVEVQARLAEKQQANVTGREGKGGLVVPSLPSKPLTTYEGGKISFSAPAESGAIPSARQSALPMAREKGIAPQSPQMGQAGKMIAGEIKDSGGKSKSPINEAKLSDSINESNIQDLNTGPVTKKQQEWITSSARKLLSSPKDLRYSPDRKGEYDGGQLVARLLNNVPPAEKTILEQAGIKERFKAGQKVSSEEVDKWIGENEPKVEVRKFENDKRVANQAGQEVARIQHLIETNYRNWHINGPNGEASLHDPKTDTFTEYKTPEEIPEQYKDVRDLFIQYRDNYSKWNKGSKDQSHWQSVAPKPESDMKDYVEIAVVKPQKLKQGYDKLDKDSLSKINKQISTEQPQFPSSHNFPPNTLGFVRGYMEGDTFHVIEVQSDWAQKARDMKQRAGEEGVAPGLRPTLEKDAAKFNDPLLAHYERLALKSAIEHARASGAKRIAIQDAESAMLMEGHDRVTRVQRNQEWEVPELKGKVSRFVGKGELLFTGRVKSDAQGHIFAETNDGRWFDETNFESTKKFKAPVELSQEKGMRLHYDQILPKMLRELTGELGEKVSYGNHKAAFTDQSDGAGGIIRGNIPRKDLIFRNPDGTPKTDVSGTMYAIDKVAQAQEKSPFTITGSDKLKETKDEQGNVQYYHAGVPIPKQAIEAGKDVLKLAGKALNLYAEPIVEKLGRVGGPVAKKATEEFQRMISRQKQVYGELSPVVDEAKKATGRVGGGNTWLRKINNITDKAGVNNMFASNEGKVVVPGEAAKTVQTLNKANLAIGDAAKLANPDFVPTGKLQRVLTNYGYDIIRRGNGPAWEAWTEGVAKANKIPVSDVQDFFGKWKEELDKPSSDVASMDRISQDFSRRFSNTVTHIKPSMAWHEVVTADPFNYIESAAQRTSHAVAFREVYPLTRDAKGKLGPSGYLQATRKAIQKELNTAGFDSNLFDNLVSAVQGHPLDTFTKGWNAPDSVVGGAYRMGQQLVGQPLKSLMLTTNTVSNAGEVLAGGPAVFLGSKNVMQAMAELVKDDSLKDYLEFIGARNKAMYNFSFDPTSPMRSISRIASSTLRKVTAQQLLNEFQELTASMGAKFVADKIRNGKIGNYEKSRIEAVAKTMGFTDAQAKKLISGDKDLLRQFETKSAAFLTGGNQSMGEKSRLGTSRAFNELFWFQTYPQMKMNQAKQIFGNLFEAANKKDWKQAWHFASLAGRFVGGTTLQGAITLMLMGLVTGGSDGFNQQKERMRKEPLKFLADSMIMGMGGPLAILIRLSQNSKDSKSLTQNLISLSPPISAGQDLIDAGAGVGRYEGRTTTERLGMFLESKTPGLEAGKTLLAVAGLSEEDLALKSAMKGFYAWRREQDGYKPASSGGGEEADVAMRTQMKRVKEAIQQGRDWKKELEKVKDSVYAQHSLRAGTMLELNAKPLDESQLASLEKRIGKKGVEKIKAYDTMLREIARELGDVGKEKKTVGDIQPTGDKYVDQTTGTQRGERVGKLVKPETLQFLETNKKKIPTFEPKFGLVGKKLMTKEQGELFEKLFAEELDKRLASVMTNQVILAKPLTKRQERIQERIELAKEMAQTRFRAAVRKDTER